MLVIYAITAAALLLLALASWRTGKTDDQPPNTGSIASLTNVRLRAGLAIVASAGVSYALSGSLLSVALLAFDVILVAVTWRFAQNGRMKSALGTAWIIALVLVLLVAKLP